MDSHDQRLREEQAARIAKETMTQQPRSVNLAKDRHVENSRIAQTYSPKHDGVHTAKEVAKEWYYHYKQKGGKAIEQTTDKEIMKGLSACGHDAKDIINAVEKHSLHAARLEQQHGKQHAKAYAAKTYHDTCHEVDADRAIKPDNDYVRFYEAITAFRQAQGVDKVSLNDCDRFSAKNRYEQQQAERHAREQQAYQVTQSINRSR